MDILETIDRAIQDGRDEWNIPGVLHDAAAEIRNLRQKLKEEPIRRPYAKAKDLYTHLIRWSEQRIGRARGGLAMRGISDADRDVLVGRQAEATEMQHHLLRLAAAAGVAGDE